MANNWAIVVGINTYKFLPKASLKFAEQDALAMRQFLCEEAGFAADQVLLCGDGAAANREATRAELRQILLNELHRAQKADNLWFFFSGHGLRDQQDYLMPIDGNPHDLHDTAIPIHFVVDQLRACEAKNIVLILDMCRDERPETERKAVESVEALRRLVQDREGQQGIITLFSCGWGESSYELTELGQGAFTYALLEGLRRQRILRDLETYLARRVPELHRSAGRAKRKQVPLVIPEPGWKYEKPILGHYTPAVDVGQLKDMAIDAESDEEIEKAIQLWKQVSLLADNQDDRRRALHRISMLGKRSHPFRVENKPLPPKDSKISLKESNHPHLLVEKPKQQVSQLFIPPPRKSREQLNIHEFSTGIFPAGNKENWVFRGFTGHYMNMTCSQVPDAIETAIKQHGFAVAAGSSSEGPVLIGRSIPDKDSPAGWAVLAVVTWWQDVYGGFGLYRYFVVSGADKLWMLVKYIEMYQEKNGQYPIFNPFKYREAGKPIMWMEPDPQDYSGNIPQYIHDKTPLILHYATQISPTQLNQLAQANADKQKSQVAWAANVERLKQPELFSVIHPASAKAESLLLLDAISTAAETR
jgi:Caspase domain